METSDETSIGAACEIQLRKQGKYQYRFAKIEDEKFDGYDNNDIVYVLTPSEHSQIMQQDIDSTKKINELEKTIADNDATIPSLNARIDELEQSLEKKNQENKTITEYKEKLKDNDKKINDLTTSNDKKDAIIEDLETQIKELKQEYLDKENSLNAKIDGLNKTIQEKNADNESINKYKQELKNKYGIINDLTTSNSEKDAKIENLENKCEDLEKEHEQEINDMKLRIDELGLALDNSISESEYGSLKEQLNNANKELEYWKNGFGEINEKNIAILDENDSLKKDNTTINETNKMLNAHNIALTSSYNETKEQILSDFEKQEKELKETIKKQQTHIDELTQKYESLIANKDYIPQTTHYKALQQLKDEIHASKLAHEQKIAELQLEHSNEKSDLKIKHANKLNEIKSNYADEKAQMLVAYNTNLNNLKHEKNKIALKYNELLDEIGTLTKWNTLFGNNHKHILDNKTPMELEDIASEQLPSADEIIEYVPKNKKQE